MYKDFKSQQLIDLQIKEGHGMSPKKKRAYAIGQYGAGNQDVSPIYSISKEMPFNFQSSTIQPSLDAPSEMQAKTLDSPLKVQDGATNRTSDDSLI